MFTKIKLFFYPARLRDEADEFFRRVYKRRVLDMTVDEAVSEFNFYRKRAIERGVEEGFLSDKWFSSPLTSCPRRIKPIEGMSSDEYKVYRDDNEILDSISLISSFPDATPIPMVREVEIMKGRTCGEFGLSEYMLVGFTMSLAYEILARNRFVDITLNESMTNQFLDFVEGLSLKKATFRRSLYYALRMAENTNDSKYGRLRYVHETFSDTDYLMKVFIKDNTLHIGINRNQTMNRFDSSLFSGYKF